MVLLIISLLKSSQNAFHCCYLGSVNLHSYQQCKRVPFSPHLFICRFLNDCLSDWCQVHFSNNQWCCTSFHVFVSHLYIFFGEMSISVFGPFCFVLVGFFFFILSCINCIFWRWILCQLLCLKVFSPILRCIFSSCLWFLCCEKAFKFN